MFKIIKNKNPKLCQAYRCKNKKMDRHRFCSKHAKRYQKEVNPENYYFNILRSNANRRGKQFSLTLEEFKVFCKRTGYLEKKGKSAGSASIDRIDPSKGYQLDNIQMITLADNTRKMHEDCPF